MRGRSAGSHISTEFILTFTPTGVITGYVYDRNTFNLRTDDELRVLAGTVRGLIGEEGMVGAWRGDVPNAVNGSVVKGGALGGFVADNPNFVADLAPSVASTADWARSFVLPLPATIAISDPGATVVGDFLNLADGATTIVAEDLKTEASGSTASASGSLTRADDTADGFVYISGFKGNNNQAFVGLLPTTDLGALLSEQLSVSIAEWAGSYYDSMNSATAATAITFNIDFSNRSISTSGISVASPPTFNLAFNDAGVITGRVSKGGKDAIARGLIGKEGLVGAFVDTSATTGSVFHGGFVASAPLCIAADTCVIGRFLNLDDGARTIAPGDLKTLSMTAITGGGIETPSVSVPLTRADDTADGFVYISGFKGDNNQAFVGLLPSTDLGALLTEPPPIAEWTGSYYDSTLKTATNAITFNIDFSNLSIDVKANSIIAASPPTFDLGFNDAGVISGTVSKGGITATARGLIGADGLVGAFIDTTPIAGSIVFHGGFVAAPSVPDPCIMDDDCIANHANWLKNFGASQPPATINASTAGTGIFGGFLNLDSGTTRIAPEDLKTTVSGTASPSVILPRNGDAEDGVVYISGFNGNNKQAFVGLLPDTDLGVTLTKQPILAEWAGSYYDSTLGTAANDIIFDIDFSNRSIDVKTGSITAAAPPAFNLDFTDAGVITGTVSKNNIHAIARGLIGIEGLVGAFIDTSAAAGSVFHGGFVATAPTCLADDTCVKHAIWLDDFGASPPPTTILASTAGTKVFGGFLNLANGATTIAPDTFDKDDFATVLTARPASETGFNAPVPTASAPPLTRDGDAMDGVVYIGGYNFNNYQAFVGLLSTTNLGDPFPVRTGGDTTAMWTGKYYSSGDSSTVSSSVPFTIDFGGARTINGTGEGADAPVFALRFIHEDMGIITGTVTAGGNEATASGLIGREGLVGVFVDTTHPAQTPRIPVLYGGFVADNPNP